MQFLLLSKDSAVLLNTRLLQMSLYESKSVKNKKNRLYTEFFGDETGRGRTTYVRIDKKSQKNKIYCFNVEIGRDLGAEKSENFEK